MRVLPAVALCLCAVTASHEAHAAGRAAALRQRIGAVLRADARFVTGRAGREKRAALNAELDKLQPNAERVRTAALLVESFKHADGPERARLNANGEVDTAKNLLAYDMSVRMQRPSFPFVRRALTVAVVGGVAWKVGLGAAVVAAAPQVAAGAALVYAGHVAYRVARPKKVKPQKSDGGRVITTEGAPVPNDAPR